MSTFTFSEKLEEGESYETELDKFYSQWFKIDKVDMSIQRLGIDRIFTSIADGTRRSVEYKGDVKAGQTGNAFVETMSVDTQNKKGWAFTSCAQVLIYYIVPKKYAIRFDMNTIKFYLPVWIKRFLKGAADNTEYKTHGVLVPLYEFKKHGVVDEIK